MNQKKHHGWHLLLLQIFWLPSILLMSMIFSFSCQTGVRSDQSSGFASQIVIEGYEKLTGQTLTEEEISQMKEQMHFWIRKTAHFSEYALLGISFLLPLMVVCHFSRVLRAVSAVGLSALYAITDEVHQLFVPDRTGCLRDVLIDASGAVCGVLICTLVSMMIVCFRKNKK